MIGIYKSWWSISVVDRGRKPSQESLYICAELLLCVCACWFTVYSTMCSIKNWVGLYKIFRRQLYEWFKKLCGLASRSPSHTKHFHVDREILHSKLPLFVRKFELLTVRVRSRVCVVDCSVAQVHQRC